MFSYWLHNSSERVPVLAEDNTTWVQCVDTSRPDDQWALHTLVLPAALLAVVANLILAVLLLRRIKLLFSTVGLFLLVAAPFDLMCITAFSLWHSWRHAQLFGWTGLHVQLIPYVNSLVGCTHLGMDITSYLMLFAFVEIFCIVVTDKNRGCFKQVVRIPLCIAGCVLGALIGWHLFFALQVHWQESCRSVFAQYTLARTWSRLSNAAAYVYPWIAVVLPAAVLLLLLLLISLINACCKLKRKCMTKFRSASHPVPFKRVALTVTLCVVCHLVFCLLPRLVLNYEASLAQLTDRWFTIDDARLVSWSIAGAELIIAVGYFVRPLLAVVSMKTDIFDSEQEHYHAYVLASRYDEREY